MMSAATSTFLMRLDRARILADSISHYLEEHMGKDPDSIGGDWRPAADALAIANKLEEIVTMYRIEELP